MGRLVGGAGGGWGARGRGGSRGEDGRGEEQGARVGRRQVGVQVATLASAAGALNITRIALLKLNVQGEQSKHGVREAGCRRGSGRRGECVERQGCGGWSNKLLAVAGGCSMQEGSKMLTRASC